MSKEYRRAKDAFASTERQNIATEWEEIATYVLPHQSGIFQSSYIPAHIQSPGSKKTRKLYDLTAVQACHDLGSSIHSTLTNPQIKWSRIRYKSEELNNEPNAVAWLQAVNDIIHTAFNESNFDTEVSRNYLSYPALGTMVLFHEVADDSTLAFGGFRFKSIHLSEIAYEENSDGLVDRVYRQFEMSAESMIKRFGTSVSDEIVTCAEKNPTKKFTVMHVVAPREKFNSNAIGVRPEERRYASLFFDSEGSLLEENGYYEMPYYVTRWSVMPGEIYGRSPGHVSIGDIRTMNQLIKLHLESVALSVAPPLIAERNNILGNLDLRPKKLNIVNDIKGLTEFLSRSDHQVAEFTQQKYEDKIMKAFFLDKLMLPPRTETGEMTAFEVSQRLQQMQKVLGSVLGRLNSEFLSPLIFRSFNMLLRSAVLPDLPPILRERGIDVEISFINGLAQAQQIEDINNIQQWVQSLAVLGQVKPEALDYIDADGIAKHLARAMYVPESAVRNDDEVQAMRAQREQALQIEQALSVGQQASEIVKNVPGE